MMLLVTRSVLERIEQEAAQASPRECCGILLGSEGRIDTAVPAANIHSSPLTHFEIDSQALIDAHRNARSGGPRVAGYYHSHPQGPARPSATDHAMANGDGMVWAIAGEGGVTFWRSDDRGFVELSYRADDS